MLLTPNFRKRLNPDGGAALAAVMSLMLLGALLSVLILASVVASIASTTTTRATVQSQASAQAGVDVALASVVSGNCVPTYTSATAPKYTATLSYTTAATLTTPGLTWVAGCPTASATFMKVTSTGTAAAVAVGKTTWGNTEAIEAIYARPAPATTLVASGPAVYAYSSQGFGGSGTLVSLDGSNDADVMVKIGDVDCQGAGGTAGDFVVKQGNISLGGSCDVTGNLWASGIGKGIVTLSGNVTVSGNIVSNGLVVSSGNIGGNVWTTGAISIKSTNVGGGITVTANNFASNGSNIINGNLWASGSAQITNGDNIKGNATAESLILNGGNIGTTTSNEAWSRGAVTGVTWYSIKAHITAKSVQSGMTAQGGITVVPAGPGAGPAAPATPVAPYVPDWVNFGYTLSDWPGYSVATLTSCTHATMSGAVASFNGGKGIIDARGCSGQLNWSNSQKLALTNDTAIFSNGGFDLKGSSGFTATTPVKLFLITPDYTVESPTAPTCVGGGFSVGGNFTFSPNISTIIYTPCLVDIGSGIAFYGQVFSGTTSIDGGADMFYTPVGLPGWDLGTGTSTTVATPPNAWNTFSTRNVEG